MKIREIAEFLGGELHGDADIEIAQVADIASAAENELAFLDRKALQVRTQAGCVLIPHGIDHTIFASSISVPEPKLAFARVAAVLHPPRSRTPEIHRSAFIASNVTIGPDAFVGAFVCIGEGSTFGDATQIHAGAKIGDKVAIGRGCVIHPNVIIEDRCSIGGNVVLHPGAVIGADGFGYVKEDDGTHVKFPQIGTVVIEDNVEIGANSCVDRGALGETRIGEGTKIDNLVQIAHNVRIGKNCIIVAMSGISGSSVLEDDVVLAGQVGIADHVTLKRGVVIAAKSAVYSNKVIHSGVWSGVPARPIKEFNESYATLRQLARSRFPSLSDESNTSTFED